MPDPRADITQILERFDERPNAAAELLPLVYDQLRGIARARMSDERDGHTLQATALVHEAYARLVGENEVKWESRAHFFRVAAEAMRRILIDHARKRNSQKRGGDRDRLPISVVDLATDYDTERVLEFDDALTKLAQEDERAAEVVHLRFDWIVMCAIEKDRARRYATANAFAEDVRRHLRAEPVEAGPPSRVYRLSRLARRHRTELTIASVILLALIATVVFSLVFAAEADRQRLVAKRELERAEEATRFAQGILEGVDPAIARGADTSLFKSILDSAAERIESEVEHPVVEAEMRLIVGTALMNLNEDDAALRQFELARDHGTETLGVNHPRVLDAEGNMVKVLAKQSKFTEALAISQGLTTRYIETQGAEHPNTLSVRSDLATLHSRLGAWEDAGRELQAIYEARVRVMGPNDRSTLTTLGNLASLRVKQGRRDEARELFSHLLERQREVWDEDHPLVMTTQGNLAYMLNEVGAYDEAEPIARDLIERRTRVLGPNHRSTILGMSNLAGILKATDRPEEAEQFYREGLRRARESLGPKHEVTLTLMVNLGDLCRRDGRLEEALELQVEARQRLIDSIGLNHPNAALFSLTVSNTLVDLERWEEAEASVRDAIHLADNALPADNWRHASFKATLGKALMGQARYGEAAPLMTRAHEVFTREFGADSAQAIDMAEALAELFERSGEPEIADTWRARAGE